mgnify:CR=1 FL=1
MSIMSTDDIPSPPGDTPANGGTGNSVPVMGSVSIKLPPFWRGDPQIWFAQAEAQFSTRQITQEPTKYAHVISVLQPEIAQEIRDILLNPPATTPYTILKEQLILRTTASEQRRVQMLLTEEELGDRKPSQLLRRMEQLVGEQTIDKGILKQLFLQRLPPNVRLILASTSDTLALSDLAELADRIIEVHIPTVGVVSQGVTATPGAAPIAAPAAAAAMPASFYDTDLREEVRKLTKAVRDLQMQAERDRRNYRRSRSKSPQRSRGVSPNNTTPASDLCWYHERWGNKATRCRPPCSRYSEFSENDLTSR